MTNLKRRHRSRKMNFSFFGPRKMGATALALAGLLAYAGSAAEGADYTLTKALIGASGASQVTSLDYSAAYSLGEDVAGTESTSVNYDLLTGYLSGFFGNSNFMLLSTTVGTAKILQDGMQVGVPLNASIQLVFSGQINPSTIAAGIQIHRLADHLGQSEDVIVASTFTYDPAGTTVIISPQSVWQGNTLYDAAANSNLLSIDGF